MKELIIKAAIEIIGASLANNPSSRVAQILLDPKVRKTIEDVNAFYVKLDQEKKW